MSVFKNVALIAAAATISLGILFLGSTVSDRMGGEGERSPFNAVMPEATDFSPVSSEGLDGMITDVHISDTGGYVFSLDAVGYYPHMMILCGVGADGKVTGAVCTESSESLGRELTYGEELVGVTAETVDEVPVITGATKTTKGYKKAVKIALEAFEILNGG